MPSRLMMTSRYLELVFLVELVEFLLDRIAEISLVLIVARIAALRNKTIDQFQFVLGEIDHGWCLCLTPIV